MDQSEESLQKLVSEYQELNGSAIDEVSDRLPTALELSRSIARNRPLVIRSYAGLQRASSSSIKDAHHHQLQGREEWTDSKLVQRLADQPITVARTPFGNADSIVDGKYFVEPAYEKVTMADFLAELRGSETASSQDRSTNDSNRDRASSGSRGDVVYLQSQDGNLSKELLPLLPNVGTHVPIASEALGTDQPDAVNLWIGDDRSITSLHNDPYENFYLLIEGSKTFTLFPPVEYYCMHEGTYRSSRYHWSNSEQKWTIIPKNRGQQMVPWIPIDPLKPDYNKYPRFRFARSMKVTLHQGDLLYLPSLWYHHVQAHRTAPNGLIIACNWWYDMNYEGAHYALFSYLRRQVLALDQSGLPNPLPKDVKLDDG